MQHEGYNYLKKSMFLYSALGIKRVKLNEESYRDKKYKDGERIQIKLHHCCFFKKFSMYSTDKLQNKRVFFSSFVMATNFELQTYLKMK